MKKTYFENVGTLEELRRQYKNLIKKFHPDNGGTVEDTQAINAEYAELFKVLKDVHEKEEAEKDFHSDYNKNMFDFENDEALREMLSRIINFNMDIEIIGAWIWCFNSYNYKKELKDLGFKYAGKKKAWYFHTEKFRKSSRKDLSIDDIRNYYGSTKIENEKKLLKA